MAAYQSKYHIGLNSVGYIISQKGGRKYYQKKRAPSFVNKFGGGDIAYRDSTFWQYFVQTNWRNGAKQLKWDDPGKFWKSQNVDTSQLEQLTLSKALVSAGQLASGIKVNALEGWRATGSTPFGAGGEGAKTVSSDENYDGANQRCSGTTGSTTLTLDAAGGFANGDYVLIHQTRGTNAGKWEKNKIVSGGGTTTLVLEIALQNSYAYGSGADQAQIIELKQYSSVTVNSTKTWSAVAWDGTKGGIVAFMCSGTTTVTGTISAAGAQGSGTTGGAGKGFRGGTGINSSDGSTAYQGEGSSGASSQSTSANGNGAGGSTKAAGSQAGTSGGGGHSDAGTSGVTVGGSTGGTGGSSAGQANLSTSMFFGGGGGGTAASDTNGKGGGGGGGIVFIITKTLTVTGSITVSGGAGQNSGSVDGGSSGGGAGGSILVKAQTATLGTNLLTAAAGAGGTYSGRAGGNGATGRIHLDYSSLYTGTTSPTVDVLIDNTLIDQAASITSTMYGGGSDGKVYSHDGSTTWTEAFDCRRLAWYDPTEDGGNEVGDSGGTEYAAAQSFQLAAAQTVKAVQVKVKKFAGTPGDITVRIETDSSSKPSGTLANASATTTIPAFTSTSYGWITCEFASSFSLAATTSYWIVLKTDAAANDNCYAWAALVTGAYASGTDATSTDGGSTWSAGTRDHSFRVLSQSTSVNCMLTAQVSGVQKLYIGTGSPTGTTNGDARLYSYDGTTWALVKSFVTATESYIGCITEYSEDSKWYLGIGPQAKMYYTADFSTFTLSKRINVPDNPGYIYALKEYNGLLFGGGGSPEQLPTQYYSGFVQYYDTTKWRKLYDYDFTVIKSMEFYDAYLFQGTYHGHLYVYDTSSLNPLFNFKDDYNYQVQVHGMQYYDDKLYLGLYPQEGTGDTNVGVWRFDRRGLSLAHYVSGVIGYRCFAVVNGIFYIGTGDNGYVYRLSTTNYETQGYYQSSYFDANLPSIPKLYNTVTVRHDPLVSGQSIVVYYKFKESDSWTTLGTSSTVSDTEEILTFPAGTTSRKISLKVELNTTTTTGTPKLTEVVMQYSLYPDKKWQWTMRLLAKSDLMLLDKTEDARTSTTIRSTLESLMDTETLYSYVDIDGTTYNVLVTDIDQNSWVVNQDTVNEDEVVLTLLEA